MKNQMISIHIVLDCIERIEEYIKDMGFCDFEKDRKTQDEVLRNIEFLGQSLKEYCIDNLANDFPGIDWKSLAGMRNIIAHDYLGVDILIFWDALYQHVAPLDNVLLEV